MRAYYILLTDAHSAPSQPWSNFERDFASPTAFYDMSIEFLVRIEVVPPPLQMVLSEDWLLP